MSDLPEVWKYWLLKDGFNLSYIAIKLEWLNGLLFLQNNNSEWP